MVHRCRSVGKPFRRQPSRAPSEGLPNTEFSGEPAALPSLVRCNSSFGGSVLIGDIPPEFRR